MTELEQKLRAAMHAAVDDEQPPRDLTTRVAQRHRRRTTMLASLSAAASVVAAIAVLTAILPSHGSSTPAGVPPGPPPLGPGHPTSELHGAAMPRGSDVRLLFESFPRIAWYSTATRRTVPIAGLPAGLTRAGLERLQGGFLGFVPYSGGPNCCRYPFYYIAPGAKVGRRIATATSVGRSSSAGAVWLTTYQSFSRHSLGRAQLISLDGQPIGRPVTLPTPRALVAAGVGRYLLLSHFDAFAGRPVKLWDPASRRVVRTFPSDAVGAEQIAWGPAPGPSCVGCPVHVFDARTRRTSTFAIPHGSEVGIDGNYPTVALSPDGTLLAVALTSDIDGPGHQAARLAVINLATGRMMIVPGVDLTTDAAGFLRFDWQSGTHRLVLTLPVPGRPNLIQVAYWQQGVARLRLTTARVPRNVEDVYVQ